MSSIVPVGLFGVGRVVVVKDFATLIDYFGINEFLEEILQLVKLLALLIFLLDLLPSVFEGDVSQQLIFFDLFHPLGGLLELQLELGWPWIAHHQSKSRVFT